MLIALDYDGTFTEDPVMWCRFVALARSMEHQVFLVTMRAQDEGADVVRQLSGKVDKFIFTDRKAKRAAVSALGYSVDVWIDDMPEFIVSSASPRDLEENARSGLSMPGDA